MPTPTPAPDHPANQLSNLLSDDFRAQLLKTPYSLPLEDQIYENRLKQIRNNWKYGAVIQWCYLFKGIIKLVDHFDINSFEEELLQLNPPTLITKLKAQLVYYLTGERITNTYLEETGEFEEALKNIIPQYFLDKYDNDAEIENFQFLRLSLEEQINIYYELIELANNKNENLRKLIDSKFEKTIEQIKPISILVFNKKFHQEEYLILPDLRLYYKELTFKKIEIPKRKSDLEQNLKSITLDELISKSEPTITKFTCISSNLYQFDEFINSQPRTSTLYKSLKPHYDEIAENDIKLRKQELSRQRQIKLQSLMVHRKRSSRLEEKEKRKLEDDERERLEYENLKRESAAARAAKRMKLRGDEYTSRESSVGLVSREERYRRKHTDSENESSLAHTPEPQQQPDVIIVDNPNLTFDSEDISRQVNDSNAEQLSVLPVSDDSVVEVVLEDTHDVNPPYNAPSDPTPIESVNLTQEVQEVPEVQEIAEIAALPETSGGLQASSQPGNPIETPTSALHQTEIPSGDSAKQL